MKDAALTSIAEYIVGYFKKGITAGQDVISFAESTLGINNPEELAARLHESDSSGDGLAELVFSPNDDLKNAIELHMPLRALSREDVEIIASHVAGLIQKVNVIVAGHSIADMATNSQMIMQFIKKLNLSIALPFRSSADFPDYLSSEDITAIRVLLRSGRYRSYPDHDRAIVSLVNGLGRLAGKPGAGIILNCLSLLLELFNANRENCDTFRMLSAEKRRYEEIQLKAGDFSEYLNTYSMDFLMAHRLQPPVADMGEIRNKIYLIDLMSTAVFNRPAGSSLRDTILHYDNNHNHNPL